MRVQSIKFHRILALTGGIALLLWGGSGLLHPMMAFFGPQQAVFFPPSRAVDMTGAHPIHETLAAAGVNEAAAVRIIASDGLLQAQIDTAAGQVRRALEKASSGRLAAVLEWHRRLGVPVLPLSAGEETLPQTRRLMGLAAESR